MDKVTRILLLYSKLIQGEEINKTLFCFENEYSPRSFDRDIDAIRLFLSDTFSMSELTYDRTKNTYSIPGTQNVKLGIMEYFFLEKILKDTAVLRRDELETLTEHLLSNTERSKLIHNIKKNWKEDYKNPVHNKALLKIYGDLVTAIYSRKRIMIRYFKADSEEVKREVIPCLLKYDRGYIYLIAYLTEEDYEYPAYYRLDRIDSFVIMADQTKIQQEKVQHFREKYSKGITQMYAGEFKEILVRCKKEYVPYVLDKFKDAEEIERGEAASTIKILAFEEGFVKWMLGQPAEMIHIKSPESTKNKLIEEALKIVKRNEGKYE